MLCLLPSQMPHPPPAQRKILLIRVSTQMITHYSWYSSASAQSSSKQTLFNYFQGPLEGKGTNLEQRNVRQLLNFPWGTWLQEALHDRQVKAWDEPLSGARQKLKCVCGGEIKKYKEERERARTQGWIYGKKKWHSQCKTDLVPVRFRQFSTCKIVLTQGWCVKG